MIELLLIVNALSNMILIILKITLEAPYLEMNPVYVEFSRNTNLMFLLLLFTRVPHVRVIFNYILAHFIHSVHQQL